MENLMEQIEIEEKHITLLYKIPLFNDLTSNVKSILLDKLDYKIFQIETGDIIAEQGNLCKFLYVLLEGELRVDIIDANGNEVMIEKIIAPRAFATPHLFSKDSRLPATFSTTKNGILLIATKDSVFDLISVEPSLLKSFLKVTGNCNKCTVKRLNALSHKGLRNRIISYILSHPVSENGVIKIEHNQVQLADYLCVTRPALSKEINKMVKEGLFKIDKNTVSIPDIPKLQAQIL